MTGALKNLLRPLLPHFVRAALKKRRTTRRIEMLKNLPPMEPAELKSFLTNRLDIRPGDTLFIHASLSDLKVNASADEVVQLLVDLVGPTGNILMPFYPLKASHEFLVEGKPFDLRRNRTSMGALVTAFAKRSDVQKSLHPTKSVAVFGKDQMFLIAEHGRSPMPYDMKSPYGKVRDLPRSKIMGLGVPADFLSCMHVGVDVSPDYPIQPYHPQALTGTVIGPSGQEVKVLTYAHDLAITNLEDVPRFLSETGCPTYEEIEHKGRTFFSVDANELIDHTIREGRVNRSFFYPWSRHGRQPKRIPIA